MTIRFFVPGIPQPGGSKRAFVIPGTNRASVVEDAKRNRPWRDRVASVALAHYQGEPLTGPLAIRIIFFLKRPASHMGSGKNARQVKASAPRFPTTRPDSTKLLRALEDALTGIVWRDDAQIVDQCVTKMYSERPGAVVVIEEKDSP